MRANTANSEGCAAAAWTSWGRTGQKELDRAHGVSSRDRKAGLQGKRQPAKVGWVLRPAATALSLLSSTAGSLCSSFLSAHLILTFDLTLERCLEIMMTSVIQKCWQYIHTTLWINFPWMVEDCKVGKGMGYWLVSFGALCLWIREILFWTWILVLWMWLLPTNSLPPYRTVLCHSGTLR